MASCIVKVANYFSFFLIQKQKKPMSSDKNKKKTTAKKADASEVTKDTSLNVVETQNKPPVTQETQPPVTQEMPPPIAEQTSLEPTSETEEGFKGHFFKDGKVDTQKVIDALTIKEAYKGEFETLVPDGGVTLVKRKVRVTGVGSGSGGKITPIEELAGNAAMYASTYPSMFELLVEVTEDDVTYNKPYPLKGVNQKTKELDANYLTREESAAIILDIKAIDRSMLQRQIMLNRLKAVAAERAKMKQETPPPTAS